MKIGFDSTTDLLFMLIMILVFSVLIVNINCGFAKLFRRLGRLKVVNKEYLQYLNIRYTEQYTQTEASNGKIISKTYIAGGYLSPLNKKTGAKHKQIKRPSAKDRGKLPPPPPPPRGNPNRRLYDVPIASSRGHHNVYSELLRNDYVDVIEG